MTQGKTHREPLLRIAKRDGIARPKAWAIRIIAVLLSLVVSGIFIFAVTKLNPIQVYEGTDGMALRNTHTRLTGHPMEIGVSEDMLGRTFNGIGVPIDGLGDIEPDKMLDVNGKPLNPVSREYPRNYIRTGISAIDGLTTLIRGRLPARQEDR